MDPSRTDPPPYLHTALAFEMGLGVAALLAAWAFGIPLSGYLQPDWRVFGWGLAATAPLLLLLAWMIATRLRPLVRLRVRIRRVFRDLFPDATALDAALLALAAGWGEELLFRGTTQLLLLRWTTPWVAIGVGGLLFGLAHALSRTYFLLATGVGVYLGLLAWWTGSLIPAIVAHALYDWVALRLLIGRSRPRRDQTPA